MPRRTIVTVLVLAVLCLTCAGKCTKDYTPTHGPGGEQIEVPNNKPQPQQPVYKRTGPTGKDKGYW
jgi:hypothetical protein